MVRYALYLVVVHLAVESLSPPWRHFQSLASFLLTFCSVHLAPVCAFCHPLAPWEMNTSNNHHPHHIPHIPRNILFDSRSPHNSNHQMLGRSSLWSSKILVLKYYSFFSPETLKYSLSSI